MILVRIALRNLWLHKFKSLIVGSILVMGTFIVVVGSAVLDKLEQTMAESIINSLTGHLQVYSGDAKDEFEIFKGDSSNQDIGQINNFPDVKKALEELDIVRTVIPMGMHYAIVFTGNVLDRRLEELRKATDQKDTERAGVLLTHIKRIVGALRTEMTNLDEVANMDLVKAQSEGQLDALNKTADDAFWDGYATQPYEVLEFLENKVAQLAVGEDLLWMRYIGTDTKRFRETFDRFEMVEGEPVPDGRRGLMFNERFRERFLKNKIARRLDRIEQQMDLEVPWEDCEDCNTWVEQNKRQAGSIVYQMDDTDAAAATASMQKALGSQSTDVKELLVELLDMNGANFRQRKKEFYDLVVPRITLYSVNVGDTMVLTGFGKGGYARKVPVKVYGVFRFSSLDKAPLAGSFNVLDLVTFRELYGFMTEERLEEIEAIRAQVGVKDVGEADEAEDALFGGDDDEALVETAQSKKFDATSGLDMAAGGERYTDEVHARQYTQEQIEGGVVLNAAVMLKDGIDVDEAKAAIERLGREKNLNIKVATWRDASGMVGDFVVVVRGALFAAVFIIFIVALVIINNAMMASTMERIREIGTMRAVGAQRGFIRTMILFETTVLAIIFGGGGAVLASGFVLWANANGIAAWNDETFFLFAGPALHPDLLASHLVLAFVTILFVGVASTAWPARIATRVTPREAMARDN